MMFSQLQKSILFYYTIVICFFDHRIDTKNVTFSPQPIRITVADLPIPFATLSADKDANIIPIPSDPLISVPVGFTIKVFMTDLITPRFLLYTPTGDILVSEPNANRISCLVDNNNDGYPDERMTFADASNKLSRPYGMAFNKGYFYAANQNGIRRYPWIRASRQISGEGELIMEIESSGHWTRVIAMSPTADKMYVGIGSRTNNDADPLPRASVQLADLDGTNQTTYAFGLRNPIGLAFHPITNELYVTCQERDGLGDDLVPDFFTRIQKDEFYGWPYAYMKANLIDPKHTLPNGTSVQPDLVARTRTPDVLFQAHSAVLDFLFYTGNQFPTRYKNGAFAAFHGSWNRKVGTGYKIVFVPYGADNRPMGYYKDFVDSFLTEPSGPVTFATPVGLLVLKDGSLIFTEDGNNRIYQVQYTATTNNGYCLSVSVIFLVIWQLFMLSYKLEM
jgi:glucose/arabinose dehydrogenase